MIRRYRVTDDTFVNRVVTALLPYSSTDTVELKATEIGDELTRRRGGEKEREFALASLTVSTLSGFFVEAQDTLSGEWLTVEVGRETIIQVVS